MPAVIHFVQAALLHLIRICCIRVLPVLNGILPGGCLATSTATTPVVGIQYAMKFYGDVKLVGTNTVGSDSTTKTLYIRVYNSGAD